MTTERRMYAHDDEITYQTESRVRLDPVLAGSPSKASIFTGTSQLEMEKAERTYMNPLGPGTYELPSLTGRYAIESNKRNIPALSFGQRLNKQGWHKDMTVDFVGKSSPPSTTYTPIKADNPTLGKINNEKKFREPMSVTTLRQTLPIQYAPIYDKRTIYDGDSKPRHSKLSQSLMLTKSGDKSSEGLRSMLNLSPNLGVPSIKTQRKYKQVSMGVGNRSDFTKLPQQKHDPGFLYDMQNQKTIIQELKLKNKRDGSVQGANTFGSTYDQYTKSVIAEGRNHYLGQGPSCDMGVDANDLTHTRKKAASIAKQTRDRGLIIKQKLWKEQKTSQMPSPGSYDSHKHNSLEDYGSRRFKALPNVSRASRDVSFAKYASQNQKIYSKGLF